MFYSFYNERIVLLLFIIALSASVTVIVTGTLATWPKHVRYLSNNAFSLVNELDQLITNRKRFCDKYCSQENGLNSATVINNNTIILNILNIIKQSGTKLFPNKSTTSGQIRVIIILLTKLNFRHSFLKLHAQ